MYVTKAHRIMQRAGPSGPFDMKQGSHLLALLIHAYFLINYDFRWQREWLLSLHCGYDMSTHTWFLYSKCNNASALDSRTYTFSSRTHIRNMAILLFTYLIIFEDWMSMWEVFFIHVKSYMLQCENFLRVWILECRVWWR